MDGVSLRAVNKGHVYLFHLNNQKAPTDDVHFRRALNYAFNYRNLLPIWDSKAGHLIASIYPGYDPDLEIYEQDLAKMEEELSLSKYSKDTPITLFAPIGDYFFDKMVLSLSADLAAAGFNIKVEQVTLSDLLSKTNAVDTTANIIPMQYAPDYPDVDNVLYSSWYIPGGFVACNWYDNPDLKAMIDKARATLDETDRVKIYQDIEQLLLDEAPAMFVTEIDPVRAFQDYIYVDEDSITGVIGEAVNFYYYRIDLAKKAELLR